MTEDKGSGANSNAKTEETKMSRGILQVAGVLTAIATLIGAAYGIKAALDQFSTPTYAVETAPTTEEISEQNQMKANLVKIKDTTDSIIGNIQKDTASIATLKSQNDRQTEFLQSVQLSPHYPNESLSGKMDLLKTLHAGISANDAKIELLKDDLDIQQNLLSDNLQLRKATELKIIDYIVEIDANIAASNDKIENIKTHLEQSQKAEAAQQNADLSQLNPDQQSDRFDKMEKEVGRQAGYDAAMNAYKKVVEADSKAKNGPDK